MSRASRPTSPPAGTARSSLQSERDQFLGTFFKKGAKITREVLDENRQLRQRVEQLELELQAMKLQVESNDAIRELIVKVRQLEEDNERVLALLHEARQESTRVEATRQQVEEELGNLAGLYVASRQLHASLDPDQVLQRIGDILEQLIGVHAYAILMLDRADVPRCLLEKNVDGDSLTRFESRIAEAMRTGTSMIRETRSEWKDTEPIACVPLRLENRVVGVIVALELFDQKTEFVPLDYELFELLGTQAAPALVAARLYLEAGKTLPSFGAPSPSSDEERSW